MKNRLVLNSYIIVFFGVIAACQKNSVGSISQQNKSEKLAVQQSIVPIDNDQAGNFTSRQCHAVHLGGGIFIASSLCVNNQFAAEQDACEGISAVGLKHRDFRCLRSRVFKDYALIQTDMILDELVEVRVDQKIAKDEKS